MEGKAHKYVGFSKGRLIVTAFIGYRLIGSKKHAIVEAKCECGNIKEYIWGNIRYGKTKGCGCTQREDQSKKMTTHGLTQHPLFKVWDNIIARCHRVGDRAYKWYGARGIILCDEWRYDFKVFYDWCINNGWQYGLEIDRHPNNDGNYEPTNCRITTSSNNCRNRRSNRLITFNNETKTLIEWAEITGIDYQTLHNRLNLKWPIDRLFEKKRNYNK